MPSLKEIYADLPKKFPGPLLDELTGGDFRWRTIKNMRSKGTIPGRCFVKISPRKVLILRDTFFEWAEENVNSNH